MNVTISVVKIKDAMKTPNTFQDNNNCLYFLQYLEPFVKLVGTITAGI
jgi:hypothetical protein